MTNTTRQKPSRKKLACCFLLIVVFIICAVLSTMTGIGIYTSLWAENGLHAIQLVLDVTREYVIAHDGQWPRSWEDLEKTLPSRERMRQWPRDKKEVQKYVHVDFDADPNELAKQDIEQFNAIRPIGPYYYYKDYHEAPALLETLRETRKSESNAEDSSSSSE